MGARRVLVSIVGGLMVIGGLVLLAMPGPGILVLAAGAAILATEFPVVRKWLKKLWEKLPISEGKKKKIEEKLPRKAKEAT